jgi:Flp pilus assembly protein TadG
MRRSRGVSAVEALASIPILMFVGLGALQFALIFHARQALQFSVL